MSSSENSLLIKQMINFVVFEWLLLSSVTGYWRPNDNVCRQKRPPILLRNHHGNTEIVYIR